MKEAYTRPAAECSDAQAWEIFALDNAFALIEAHPQLVRVKVQTQPALSALMRPTRHTSSQTVNRHYLVADRSKMVQGLKL